MPQALSPFLGGFYTDRTRLLNAQRLVNGYPQLVDTKDGKEVGAIYGTPGLRRLATIGDGPIRGLQVMQGLLYVVSGNAFYRCGETFSPTLLGHLATSEGPVGMANSGDQMLITDGLRAYGFRFESYHNVFHPVVLPFDPASPLVCAYQDGFFLLNESQTQNWWQSNPTEAEPDAGVTDVFVWEPLNFETADGAPDNIVAMVDLHREVWLFGQTSTEVWINAGLPHFSFQRLQGVFIQQGCAASFSAIAAGSSLMWLGRDLHGQGVVYRSNGYQPQRVSTHAIEREIQSYSRIDDAIAYFYQQEGHGFYVLTFPSADVTWCYDTATGLWHERARFEDSQFKRHRSNCYAFFGGEAVVGDFEDGRLYAFDLDKYTDDGQILKRLRSWAANRTGEMTRKNVAYKRLELYCEPGVGIVPETQGNFPQIMLRTSDNGGMSFQPLERWASPGKVGEVDNRTIWRRLGSARDRVFEISMTDPVKCAFVSAFVDSEVGLW